MSADGMYKAILKEIGAEESNVGYLFDESDDEDSRGDDYKGEENNLVEELNKEIVLLRQIDSQYPTNDFAADDDHLLHHWESEFEDNVVDDPNKINRNADDVRSKTTDPVRTEKLIEVSSDNNVSAKEQPAWKQMLKVANAKQEQLMGQMINLQMAQKESSPRNKIKRPDIDSEKTPTEASEEISVSTPVVLQEISDNDPNLNSSLVSSGTIQQLSTRNVKLQDQWQSQQEKSAKLQSKLTVMQTDFYNQQEQWEKEQRDLFSPTRSPTRIPKWHSSTSTINNSVTETPTIFAKMENEADLITPNIVNKSTDNTSSQELEAPKALIIQLQAQLEEAQKSQQSQKDELSHCKEQLKKRDVEHQAFQLRYETEKKSWKDEMKDKEEKFHHELQSRDADLEDSRQKLHQQIGANQILKENHQTELNRITSNAALMEQEFQTIKIHLKSEIVKYHKQSARIQDLEDKNRRLKTDFTRKENIEKTQHETKVQMQLAMEERSKITRELQSQIRELGDRHAEEVEGWKAEVDDYRRQIELNSTQMESQLEDANARYAKLERKHDKEVKEWQLLLDANITKPVAEESSFDEFKKNLTVIGADSATTELLSPIRKVPLMHSLQNNNDEDHNKEYSSDGSNSPNKDAQSIPSESMTMIDDLLEELGEMDLERNAILKEINGDDDNSRNGNAQIENKAGDSATTPNSSGIIEFTTNGKSDSKTDEEIDENNFEIETSEEEEPPKQVETPHNSWDHAERTNVNISDTTNDSEVLDETLHLLNNLKNMLTNHGEGNERETTVLERLEVLSELMQSQDHSNSVFIPGKPDMSETHSRPDTSSESTEYEPSFAIPPSQWNTNDTSSITATNPWPALVAELKNRCQFLEQDRDELKRITEQILERERASHKAELEATLATAERKANETFHRFQLQSNLELEDFYQNIYFQCQQEDFDYSIDQKEPN